MSSRAVGQLLFGYEGRMHIRTWEGQYYICSRDLGIVFFMGADIPVLKKESGTDNTQLVSGSVFLGPSGQAVIIVIGNQRYMIPREKFLAVAFGDEVSCIFFEIPTDQPGTGTIPDSGGRDP